MATLSGPGISTGKKTQHSPLDQWDVCLMFIPTWIRIWEDSLVRCAHFQTSGCSFAFESGFSPALFSLSSKHQTWDLGKYQLISNN